MATLAAALHDAANITQSLEFGSQDINTTGIITAGGMVIPRPHACFSHSASITLTGGTTAQAIPFDTDEIKVGITHSTSVNPSRITLPTAGTYRIIYSVIAMGGSLNKLFNVWFAVDGTNIARSNTIRNLSTASVERIVTVSIMYTFTAGQYFEIMMWSDATNTQIVATGTQANPTRPACPSIILDCNKVST